MPEVLGHVVLARPRIAVEDSNGVQIRMPIRLETGGGIVGRGELPAKGQLAEGVVVQPDPGLPSEQASLPARALLPIVCRCGTLRRYPGRRIKAAFQIKNGGQTSPERLVAAHAPARAVEVTVGQLGQVVVARIIVRIADRGIDNAVQAYPGRGLRLNGTSDEEAKDGSGRQLPVCPVPPRQLEIHSISPWLVLVFRPALAPRKGGWRFEASLKGSAERGNCNVSKN
ncbi:hypothetical protein D3C72_1276590 [compost metagenome]